MSRHLYLLGLIAVPAVALTACDTQSPLAKAQPGECYTVVGKDSAGQPQIAKTPCAGSPAAQAAACPTPATPVPGAPTAACPTTASVAGATSATGAAATHKAASSGATVKQAVRRTVHTSARSATRTTGRTSRTSARTSHASRDYAVARSGEVTSLGLDYARVDQELAGGPGYGQGYERDGGYARGGHAAGGYERREHYRRADHLPPPPAYHARGASVEYSERSRQSRSYSEAYSSSSYSSSRGGYGRVECDCEPGGRGQPPHSPFDGYGYLTWRGKTPG